MNYVNLYKDLTNMHEFLHIPYVAIVTGNMWIFVELNPEKNYFWALDLDQTFNHLMFGDDGFDAHLRLRHVFFWGYTV